MRMKAFPTLKDNGHITTQDGMNLRDWMAGLAMQGILNWSERGETVDSLELGAMAYKIADAMMKARGDD
jgi:hypothetical protein